MRNQAQRLKMIARYQIHNRNLIARFQKQEQKGVPVVFKANVLKYLSRIDHSGLERHSFLDLDTPCKIGGLIQELRKLRLRRTRPHATLKN